MAHEPQANAGQEAGETFYGTDVQGLSITHEQVNDVYTAGTSDGLMMAENGRHRKFNRNNPTGQDMLGPEG